MSALLQSGAAVCTVLGLLSGAAATARTRDLRLGVRVLVEFLLAGSLLRLVEEPGWRQLLTAALTVAVRALLSYGLRRHVA